MSRYIKNVDLALQYADGMLSHIPQSVKDSIDGWHFHFYPQTNLDIGSLQYAAGRWRQWIDSNSGGELWLTETGIIGGIYLSQPREAKEVYAREVMQWLCETTIIDRSAWFCLRQYNGFQVPSADLYDDEGQLTEFGRIYGQEIKGVE